MNKEVQENHICIGSCCFEHVDQENQIQNIEQLLEGNNKFFDLF